MKILVTGATGYVGGRLIPKLLQLGFDVRILARNPDRIQNRSWYSQITCPVKMQTCMLGREIVFCQPTECLISLVSKIQGSVHKKKNKRKRD